MKNFLSKVLYLISKPNMYFWFSALFLLNFFFADNTELENMTFIILTWICLVADTIIQKLDKIEEKIDAK